MLKPSAKAAALDASKWPLLLKVGAVSDGHNSPLCSF